MKTKFAIVLNGDVDVDLNNYKVDTWIAVDGGIDHLDACGIIADYYIGDMDSSNGSKNYINKVQYDPIKNETDFTLALDMIKNESTLIFGFLKNKRIEHFYANLKLIKQNMTYIYNGGQVYLLNKGIHLIKQSHYKYISFFSNVEKSKISIKNAKYEIKEYQLINKDILPISNEFITQTMELNIHSGEVIVFISYED